MSMNEKAIQHIKQSSGVDYEVPSGISGSKTVNAPTEEWSADYEGMPPKKVDAPEAADKGAEVAEPVSPKAAVEATDKAAEVVGQVGDVPVVDATVDATGSIDDAKDDPEEAEGDGEKCHCEGGEHRCADCPKLTEEEREDAKRGLALMKVVQTMDSRVKIDPDRAYSEEEASLEFAKRHHALGFLNGRPALERILFIRGMVLGLMESAEMREYANEIRKVLPKA